MIIHILKRLWEQLVALILPRRCVGCSQLGEWLCPTCTPSGPPRIAEETKTISAFRYNRTTHRLLTLLSRRGVRDCSATIANLIHQQCFEYIAEIAHYHPGAQIVFSHVDDEPHMKEVAVSLTKLCRHENVSSQQTVINIIVRERKQNDTPKDYQLTLA